MARRDRPVAWRTGHYLALRRALGYRLARPEKLLGQFLDHLDRAGESRITVAVALDWAQLPAGGGSNWWAYRLSAVRGFATNLHAIDPAHEGPRRTCCRIDRCGPARTCTPTPTSPR